MRRNGGKNRQKERTGSKTVETSSTDTVVGVDTEVNEVKEDSGNLSTESQGQELDDRVVGLELLKLEDGVNMGSDDANVEEEVGEVEARKTLLVEGEVPGEVPATADGVGEVHVVVGLNTSRALAVGNNVPPDVDAGVVSDGVADSDASL